MVQITKEELKIKITNKEIKSSKMIWKLLSSENINAVIMCFGQTRAEKLYNWIYDIEYRQCKQCGSLNNLSFNSFLKGYLDFCTPKCASDWYRENETEEQNKAKGEKISNSLKTKSSEEWKLITIKQQTTKEERYGDKHFNNIQKHQKTMIEKYGVSTPLQVNEFNTKFKNTLARKDWSTSIDARQKTLLSKTGYEHQLFDPNIKEKIKQTNLRKYGVENPSQVPIIMDKKITTHLKNYGVLFPAQHLETFEKQQKQLYRRKELFLPSGQMVKLQGYEPHTLFNELLQKYNEEEIIFSLKDMPEIWYFQDNKKHRYFPDFYIPDENKIIEVKSVYTMKVHLEKNLLKKARCIEMGFNFEFRIYDNKMKLIDEKEFLI